jgi:hypothetical protein
MKYLRKFNESTNQELDFEDFKMIIDTDIADEFGFEITFNDYSNDEVPFYNCRVTLPISSHEVYPDDISFSIDYLSDFLPDYDSPEEIVEDPIMRISHNISKMESLKNEIERSIYIQKKYIKFFELLINKTIPRLKGFSNCDTVGIGFDQETVRICFDLNTEDKEEDEEDEE